MRWKYISFPGKQSPFLQPPNHISTRTVGDFKATPVLPEGGPQKLGQTTVTSTTSTVPFEGFYNCVHLGKVLFGMCMFSKYWVCREASEKPPCFSRVSVSLCQVAAGYHWLPVHRQHGEPARARSIRFEGFSVPTNFSFACYSFVFHIFADRLFPSKSPTSINFAVILLILNSFLRQNSW